MKTALHSWIEGIFNMLITWQDQELPSSSHITVMFVINNAPFFQMTK